MWSTDWILLGWIPNKLPEFFGGKTGYTVAAGYNFTMRAGDGKGHMVDVVILGATSHEARFNEAKDIAEWVFANYDW
jgi:D-alanyl-D-alanine carboxypeptidase